MVVDTIINTPKTPLLLDACQAVEDESEQGTDYVRDGSDRFFEPAP